MIAHGLGAERVELLVGYVSLAISIGIDEAGITRMRRVGELGVNQRHVNGFLCAAVVSFLSCGLGGLAARWSGSSTITTVMIASILMLVPGVPAVNALDDILEGHPTLGSAPAMTVVVILMFLAAGLWLANASLNGWHSSASGGLRRNCCFWIRRLVQYRSPHVALVRS